jgi:hypothetical protein
LDNLAAVREARESEKPLLDEIQRLESENAVLRKHLAFAVRLFDGLPLFRGTAQVEAMRTTLAALKP